MAVSADLRRGQRDPFDRHAEHKPTSPRSTPRRENNPEKSNAHSDFSDRRDARSISHPPDPAQIIVAGAVELTGYQGENGERLWWAKRRHLRPAALPLVAGDACTRWSRHRPTAALLPFKTNARPFR